MTKYYENPIKIRRKSQLKSLDNGNQTESLKEIFDSIPKNFRKIFMYEANFDKAYKKCGMTFDKRLKDCLKYCIEIIA